jgi:hypothetical protein
MPPPGQGSSASLPKPLCSDNLGSANLTDAGVRSMVINLGMFQEYLLR